MNLKHIAAAAAVLAAGSPAIASAQQTPVAIAGTQITPSYGIQNDLSYPGLVTVAFVNHRNVPATEVDFNLEANGGVVDSFKDVGTFSNGITIRHNFQTLAENLNQRVTIASITFADGSTWSNDEAGPRALRQADVSYVGDFASK